LESAGAPSLGVEAWLTSDGATGAKKKFDDIFSRVDTIHQCDRQTDGWTDGRRVIAKTALTHSVTR